MSRLLRTKELIRSDVSDYVEKILLAPTLSRWKTVDVMAFLWMFSKLSVASKLVTGDLSVD